MMVVRRPAKKVSEGEARERLLVEAAQKDASRFAELYEMHFERVHAFIARRVRHREEAQDLTADVFHRALANLPRFEWRGAPFASWLLRIAANAIADRWQQVARERGNPAPPDAAELNVADIERRAQLFRLVHKLPAGQRRVIELRFAEEKSIREIALELQRSEGAIKQLQFRALQDLRARLGKKSGEKHG
jgi:RNA polymerase sigma-70 factor (ECF subfamily)